MANRPGNSTQNARERMFLSWQTFEGIQITVYSLIEATRYLLQNGVNFVLSEKFNQDVVEEYFGRHRSLGRRSDNPTIHQFGYNSNTLCIVLPLQATLEMLTSKSDMSRGGKLIMNH